MKTKIVTHYKPSEFGDFKTRESVTHEYCDTCHVKDVALKLLESENKKLRECLKSFIHVSTEGSSTPETWFSKRARECLKEIK